MGKYFSSGDVVRTRMCKHCEKTFRGDKITVNKQFEMHIKYMHPECGREELEYPILRVKNDPSINRWVGNDIKKEVDGLINIGVLKKR